MSKKLVIEISVVDDEGETSSRIIPSSSILSSTGTRKSLHSVEIPIVGIDLTQEDFDQEYRRVYGHSLMAVAYGLTEVARTLVSKGWGYCDSWKKRGELRSIIPNVDRKFDRLSNLVAQRIESGVDTPANQLDRTESAADLLCYCFLYVFDWMGKNAQEAYKLFQKGQDQFYDRYEQSVVRKYVADKSGSS